MRISVIETIKQVEHLGQLQNRDFVGRESPNSLGNFRREEVDIKMSTVHILHPRLFNTEEAGLHEPAQSTSILDKLGSHSTALRPCI